MAKMNSIKDIPANPNSIEIGFVDPTPEAGKKFSLWRATISWFKGWGSTK